MGRFRCEICDKSYPTNEKIKLHNKNQHRHVTKECPKCLIILNVRSSYYDNHVKRCFKNLFYCHICFNKNGKSGKRNKYFKSVKRFKEHYFTAHKEKDQILNLSKIRHLLKETDYKEETFEITNEKETFDDENQQVKTTKTSTIVDDNDSETSENEELLNDSHDDIEEIDIKEEIFEASKEEETLNYENRHVKSTKKSIISMENDSETREEKESFHESHDDMEDGRCIYKSEFKKCLAEKKKIEMENEFIKIEKICIERKLSDALSKIKRLENEIKNQPLKRGGLNVTIFDRMNGHI